MLLLLLTLIATPAEAASAPALQFTSLERILAHGRGTDGCVNLGGPCTGELPCCGEAVCYQYRCIAVPPQSAPERD
jgi:hypothetical protein